jgi:hypothetical protein
LAGTGSTGQKNRRAAARAATQVDVLGHPLGPCGFGDRDVAVLHMPAQDDLRHRPAVRRGDPLDRRVVELSVVVPERAVGFHGDPVLCARVDHRGVGEVRVQLDLVDGRFDPGLGDDPFQVRWLEVRNADAAGAPVGNELGDGLPCRDIVAAVKRWKGPVDEEQVDLIDTEG